MTRSFAICAAAALGAALGAAPAQAYEVFFGADPGAGGAMVAGGASAARAAFLARLDDAGIEDFESWTEGDVLPAELRPAVFAGSPDPTTATLTPGDAGTLARSTALVTNTAAEGAFPASGDRYLIVSQARNLEVVPIGEERPEDPPALIVDFGAPVSAFGFYGMGMSDHLWGAQVNLILSNGDEFAVSPTDPAPEGDLLFFGIAAQSAAETFSSVVFEVRPLAGLGTTGDTTDPFGLDDLIVGAPRAASPPAGVPLPAAGLLLTAGIGALAGLGRGRARAAR
ncbi:VPLPA-CTERM sorting domain-containing protein [Oceanicella actignis]|uniref:VPLPA-CTERM sorting domain-containing protein n=1 Tax=Oceanicella actignis TaxID=1189325 RepID=UPI0011E7104D|nr:VPLPA-CTERM sorting domain-containing protein [Oceanicella actignis]TYO89433.1 putative secreted protein [Oceanicella actignis]